MSYKEKFNASQDKAHAYNIATKILRDLTELRSKVENSTTAPRRWVWELIQNAKDVHPEGGVKIKIEFGTSTSSPYVAFKHNGRPFTADNIRFLIEQISSKERTKDEDGKRKNSGKFGTGFLTTHLLSEIVTIEAVAKEPELDYRKFVLKLDRSGYEPDEITEAVQTAKKSVEDLDARPVYSEYVEGEFNTMFHYPLADPVSLNVAKEGSTDIENCLPYALIFVPEIENVEVLPNNCTYKYMGVIKQLNEVIQIVSVSFNGNASFSAVILRKNFTNILIPVILDENSITLLPIADHVPRLFCDFPLIGTEKFPFPVVINNPHFNPTDPRDGVFLTTTQRANPQVEENKEIMGEALELYFQLLEFASNNKWKNLHVLAQIQSLPETIDWVDDAWFISNILEPIRNKLLYTPIVYTADNNLASILTQGKPYTWFPSASKKEIREQIWTSANYWFSHCLPIQSDIELWNRLAWKDCGRLSVTVFAQFVQNQKDIIALEGNLKNVNVFKWLNDFYILLKEEKEYDTIINTLAIFPNQNGTLCLKANLYKDEGNIGDDFKDILKLLGKDIRTYLVDENIEEDFKEKVRDQLYAVREITSEVIEKTNNRDVAKSYAPAFKKILLWFGKYPTDAETLFPTILKQKHLLYNDDEISENLTKSGQLDDLFVEFDVSSIAELRERIGKNKNNESGLLTLTQDILVSMGITSIEEWTKALEDKNLAELFAHESTPTPDMFFYAQGLIVKAKKRIIEHLQTLSSYDLKDIDETAPTVLAGILKDGQPISIVARPAYGGEVIIYYGSEQNVLDYEPSELWVDVGSLVKRISLGHILKKGQIRKFPI